NAPRPSRTTSESEDTETVGTLGKLISRNGKFHRSKYMQFSFSKHYFEVAQIDQSQYQTRTFIETMYCCHKRIVTVNVGRRKRCVENRL
ncbi:unnamed protein product, partial [Rotaria sp. Silwood1]